MNCPLKALGFCMSHGNGLGAAGYCTKLGHKALPKVMFILRHLCQLRAVFTAVYSHAGVTAFAGRCLQAPCVGAQKR